MSLPFYQSAGAGAATTSTTTFDVPYPATVNSTDLLILHVQDFSGTSITTPSGWTFINGSAIGRAYYKEADGTETGSLTVTGTFGGNLTMGRIYSFANYGGAIIEASATATGTGTTVNDQGVTTTDVDRLAINLVGVTTNSGGVPAFPSFTGETGGDWTETLAEYTTTIGTDGGLQLQTAGMASAATISGGSMTVTAADSWRVIGFAIIGGGALIVSVGQATETDTAFALTVTTSVAADAELYAGIAFDANTPGDFTDLSAAVASANIRRGRPFNLDRVDSSTASTLFRDGTGALDPSNTASPYYPDVLPLKPQWLYKRLNGTTYHRFTGRVERYKAIWVPPSHQDMQMEASDAFEKLANIIIESDQATLTTALTGANNDLVFTAVDKGGQGDDITITYVVAGLNTPLSVGTNTEDERGGNTIVRAEVDESSVKRSFGLLGSLGRGRSRPSVPVTVSVQGSDIIVNVATDGAGAATSTANDVKAGLDASPEVMALVTVALAPANTGAGVVTAMAKTNLSGGKWVSEPSGTRITRVLDAIGWSATLRDIDTGAFDVCAKGFSLKDNTSALAHIQDVADSELGYVFVTGEGVITYHDGAHRATDSRSTTSQATYTTTDYVRIDNSLDKDRIVNEVTVTAGAVGAVAQTASDATSQALYGRRTMTRSTQLQNDADALTIAEAIVAAFKDPRSRFEQITLMDDGTATWAESVLAREIGDRITLSAEPPAHDTIITYDCFIEEIQDDVQPGIPWTTTFQLSPISESTAEPPPAGGGGAVWDSSGDDFILDDVAAGVLG